MQKRMQKLTDEQKKALIEQRREVQRILRGIPEEAIELLKEEFGYGYPVYEWQDKRGNFLDFTPEERAQRAIHKDGQHSVIAFILRYRQ